MWCRKRLQPSDLHFGLLPLLVIHVAVGTVMARDSQEFKVSPPIVVSHTVLVMDDLLAPQRTPDGLRDDEPMLEHVAAGVSHPIKQVRVLLSDGKSRQAHVPVIIDPTLQSCPFASKVATRAWSAAPGPLLATNRNPDVTRVLPVFGTAVDAANQYLDGPIPAPLDVAEGIGHAWPIVRFVRPALRDGGSVCCAVASELASPDAIRDYGGWQRALLLTDRADEIDNSSSIRVNVLVRPIHQGVSNAWLA